MDKTKATVDIGSVNPWPGNARRGNMDIVRASVKKHGQYRDILVQKSSNKIIAGHNTWIVMQEEGHTTIDVDFLDVDDDQALEILLVDNKANDEATYDTTALAELLKQMEGKDLTGTGFTENEVGKLLDKLANTGTDSGDLPPVPVTSETDLGDIWQLGPHRIMCGDITNTEHLDALLDGETPRLTVTSPPYNQGLNKFKASGMQAEAPNWVHRMSGSYDDDRPEPEYQLEQIEVLKLLHSRTAPDGALFYNHKVRYRDKEILHPFAWIMDTPWRIRQEIIWDRTTSITLNARMLMPVDERIFWMTRSEDFHFNDTPDIKAFQTIWEIVPRSEQTVTAPYPVEVPSRCIKIASERGDIVLDPYNGSGTTVIAAEELGRVGYGLEVNPIYVDVSVARWEALTGEKAVKL